MAIPRLTAILVLLLVSVTTAAHELRLIKEAKLRDLVEGFREDEKIEASGVYALEGTYFVVLDGHEKLLAIDDRSWSADGATRSDMNGVADQVVEAEGLAYEHGSERWYLVEEAKKRAEEDDSKLLNARVRTFEISADLEDVDRKNSRWLPYNFQTENKGVEGLAVIERGGARFLLALCEGNDCDGGDPGEQPGNGRIKVFETAGDRWDYEASISLPRSVGFIDYSGLDLRDERIAVTSQRSSELWLGRLRPSAWRVADAGRRYSFPKSSTGEREYCNIEGVSWIDAATLTVVSDAKKSDDPQSCAAKEQSIHVFQIVD